MDLISPYHPVWRSCASILYSVNLMSFYLRNTQLPPALFSSFFLLKVEADLLTALLDFLMWAPFPNKLHCVYQCVLHKLLSIHQTEMIHSLYWLGHIWASDLELKSNDSLNCFLPYCKQPYAEIQLKDAI